MLKLFKSYKKISIVLIMVFTLFVFANNIYATDGVMTGAQQFLQKGNEDILDMSQIKITSNLIYNVLFAVGSVIIVIVGAILGIQFILGSAEEKAKIQETLIPYIIGAIAIWGSFAIWKLVGTVLNDL